MWKASLTYRLLEVSVLYGTITYTSIPHKLSVSAIIDKEVAMPRHDQLVSVVPLMQNGALRIRFNDLFMSHGHLKPHYTYCA